MSSLLRISDLTVEAIKALVYGSLYYEQNPQDRRGLLARHKAALVFLKPSLRTRGAFQGAVEELGGNVHCYGPQEVGLGERESPADVARTLKALGYSIIGARVYQHEDLLQMRAACDISVINLLSNDDHPTQAIADALTLYQAWGRFWGRTVAWVGDGNNTATSFVQIMLALGVNVNIATPGGEYALAPEAVAAAQAFARQSGAKFWEGKDPMQAVDQVDAIAVDVWASMHQKDELEKRRSVFAPYQLNRQLLTFGGKGCNVLHCLPANRGWEITDDVIDDPASLVWKQAGNRLVAARGVLVRAAGLDLTRYIPPKD